MGDISDEGCDLFVVSTLGQVSNANRVIARLGLENPQFVVLFTRKNRRLRRRIAERIEKNVHSYINLALPAFASLRLPWQIWKIRRAYDMLALDNPRARLWMANINSHYGYLGHVFARQGCQVNYFEEGLSSYLLSNDPRLKISTKRSIGQTLRAIWSVLFHSERPFLRRPVTVLKLVLIYLFSTRPVRFVTYKLGHPSVRYFHKNWTTFDYVAATYPELMDPRLYQANRVIRLDLPDPSEIGWLGIRSSGIGVLNDLTREVPPLFVSQYYGITPKLWGESIADILLDRGYVELLIKFHPREQTENRDILIEVLEKAGITVFESTELDKFPVEDLVHTIKPCEVIGLTSTALLHIATGKEETRVNSLGFLLHQDLQGKTATSHALNIFRLDNELLARMSVVSGAEIEFWQ